jgi:hypothetical protein
MALQDADYSPEITGRFFRETGIVPKSDLSDIPATADDIFGNYRREWIEFYTRHWGEFMAHVIAAIRESGAKAAFNSAWTKGPVEAIYRYGADYKAYQDAGADSFIVEDVAADLFFLSNDDNSFEMPHTRRKFIHYEFASNMMQLRACLPAGKFSVKCRLGWEDAAADFPRILDCLAAAGPDETGIHARTRKQLYGGTPDFSYVGRAVQHLPCPVLANGDITTLQQALECLDTTGAAGLMIGRGAVRNPYIFRQLKGGPAPTADEMQQYYTILIEETGRVLLHKRTEKGHCNRMKKYLAFCYPDFPAEQEYALRRCTSIAEMQQILTQPFTTNTENNCGENAAARK